MKLFNQVPTNRPKKNVFDLSHEKKLSFGFGDLVPVYLQEIMPGDKFRCNSEIMARLSPMLAPVMARMNIYLHYFFVPNRILYKEWEKFITGGSDGNQVPSFPNIALSNFYADYGKVGTLWDYLGLPIVPESGIAQTPSVNALPFRAYQKIYNEYYRDQNLIPEVAITDNSTVDSTEQVELLTLRKRAWPKDYFTSCMPYAQKGGEVLLPNALNYYENSNVQTGPESSSAPAVDGSLSTISGKLTGQTGQPVRIENIEALEISINDLRKASRLQEWLERNARSGSRLVEFILSHWGEMLPDYTAQRPIYLGGGKQPMVISEVLSHFKDTNTNLGDFAGHGISVGNTAGFKAKFKEHGYILGILSAMPVATYQQGFPRTFLITDKFDFPFPEFAHLGEQEVYQGELLWDYQASAQNLLTFGYQSRYAQHKYNMSSVHGDFRETLAFWHMGRIFDSVGLNKEFVECDTSDIEARIFPANNTHQKIYAQIYHNIGAVRPLPYFGVPKL